MDRLEALPPSASDEELIAQLAAGDAAAAAIAASSSAQSDSVNGADADATNTTTAGASPGLRLPTALKGLGSLYTQADWVNGRFGT